MQAQVDTQQQAQAQPSTQKLEYLLQDPTRWGSHFWYVLHTIAANFRIDNARLRLRRDKSVSQVALTGNAVHVEHGSHAGAPLTGIVKEYLSESEIGQAYFTFFDSLQYVLPCPSCRLHYSEYLLEHPIDDYLSLASAADANKWLDVWLLGLHNTVNRHHNVPEWTIDQVRRIYDPTVMFDPDNPDVLIPTTGGNSNSSTAAQLLSQAVVSQTTTLTTQPPLASQLQNAQKQLHNPKIVLDNMTIRPMGFSSFNSSQTHRATLGMTTTGTPGSLLFANNRPRFAEPAASSSSTTVRRTVTTVLSPQQPNVVWPKMTTTSAGTNSIVNPIRSSKFGTIAQQFQKPAPQQPMTTFVKPGMTAKCTGSSCKAVKGKRKCGCRR
jgi:hypothetical protein